MTEQTVSFEKMLDWFTPDDTVYNYCDECGVPIESPDGRRRKTLCADCRPIRQNQNSMKSNRNNGKVMYHFDDPIVDLVYAVIKQALDDRDWQRKTNPDGHELSLVDCGAREFIEDGGVELWLAALGIGLKPSLVKMVRTP